LDSSVDRQARPAALRRGLAPDLHAGPSFIFLIERRLRSFSSVSNQSIRDQIEQALGS
jgi:hypothetical protein